MEDTNIANLYIYIHDIIFIIFIIVINLIIWVPMIGKLLFRKNQMFHRYVTSDIPGNPHAFDDLIISLMRTLPEPSNFNICWTGLPLGRPLRINGVFPPARINSITVYPRGSSDAPCTLDLSTLKASNDRAFEVFLHPRSYDINSLQTTTSVAGPGFVAHPDTWPAGFIAMRNFAVPAGTRVVTPSICCAETGIVVRPAQVLVAGNTGVKGIDVQRMQKILAFNIFIIGAMYIGLGYSIERAMSVFIGGMIGSYAIYQNLFLIGKRGLKRHMTNICPHNHVFVLPDIKTASETSQPSREHRYWVMRYDLRALDGDDIIVTSTLRSKGQKYWSLVAYDEYGLPLPQFANIENTFVYEAGSTEIRSVPQYEVNIRITKHHGTRASSSGTTRESDGKEANTSSPVAYCTLDVSSAPVGYLIFRIVHPLRDDTVDYSFPSARIDKGLL